MSFLLSIIRQYGIPFVAVLSGIRSFRDLNPFCKIIFIQVVVYLFASMMGNIVIYWQVAHHVEQNNQFLWNIHLLLETTLLLLAAFFFFTGGWKKKLTIVLLLAFLCMWIIQMTLNSLMIYSHYTDLTACFIISLISILVLYEIFLKTEKWNRQPEVYICIGLLGYYASSVPYIALMGYLQEKQPQMNTFLFHAVNVVLANVRYLGVVIAFWLVRKNKYTAVYE